MKFLCLAYEEERALNALSESEWHALRKETLDYVDRLQKSGRLILAQALQSATTASTLRVRSGKLSVIDGPFAETKEQIGGFFLIEAGDFDEAVQIAAQLALRTDRQRRSAAGRGRVEDGSSLRPARFRGRSCGRAVATTSPRSGRRYCCPEVGRCGPETVTSTNARVARRPGSVAIATSRYLPGAGNVAFRAA